MTDRQIRAALPDDARAAARVQLAGWRTTYRGIFPDDVLDAADLDTATAKWHRRLAGRGAVAFLATAANAVVGIAAGGPPGNAPRLAYPAELTSLYLLPEWRRQGIGRALLARVFAAFLGQGHDGSYLWCLAGNSGGRAWFMRLGGHEAGTALRPSVGGLVRPSVAIAFARDAMAALGSARDGGLHPLSS